MFSSNQYWNGVTCSKRSPMNLSKKVYLKITPTFLMNAIAPETQLRQ